MLVESSPEDFLRSVDEAKAERRRQRSIENRLLDPWERYRALTDHYDALQALAEQSDRKTRFALLILGSINAINLLIVMRGDAVGLPQGSGSVASGYVTLYALLSLTFFFYAIAALRPRATQLSSADTKRDLDSPPSLRLADGVLRHTLDEYCENWRKADVGQLNRELASQVYASAHDNSAKLRALQRVYVGLYVLVGLTAGLLVVLAGSRFLS